MLQPDANDLDATYRHPKCGRLTSIPAQTAAILQSGYAGSEYAELFCTGCLIHVPAAELEWAATGKPVFVPPALSGLPAADADVRPLVADGHLQSE